MNVQHRTFNDYFFSALRAGGRFDTHNKNRT